MAETERGDGRGTEPDERELGAGVLGAGQQPGQQGDRPRVIRNGLCRERIDPAIQPPGAGNLLERHRQAGEREWGRKRGVVVHLDSIRRIARLMSVSAA